MTLTNVPPVADLLALISDLTDSEQCDFDHHGYCQTHGWFDTDPPCPNGRAQKLLEAVGQPDVPHPDTVRLWLALRRPDGNADTLFTRDIRTAHTPLPSDRPGDMHHRIMLWTDTYDQATLQMPVRNVYWDDKGRCNAELWDLLRSPTDDARNDVISGRLRPALPWEGERAEVVRLLADAGWAEWDGQP